MNLLKMNRKGEAGKLVGAIIAIAMIFFLFYGADPDATGKMFGFRAFAYCDTSQTDCTTNVAMCGSGRTWFSTVNLANTQYGQCCGNNATLDDFGYASADITTATSASCQVCCDGTNYAATTYYGNGYFDGVKTSSTTGTCFYSDIQCAATPS
ncbi:hypothetical protein COV21_01190, partial [Candidatus Woesearchaeota archaeon CG10_big_fil_rev_8_21_14_0_10_45_5]